MSAIGKPLLALALLLGVQSPALAAWAEVQAWGVTATGGAGTTQTHAYATNPTAGSLLVCFAKSSTGVTHNSVSSAEGSWTQFPTGSPQTNASGMAISAWYLASAAGGATTVTVTYSGSIGGRGLLCGEYSGTATSPMDVSAGASRTNPGTATDGVTTGDTAAAAQDNSLVIAGAVFSTTVGITVGTGFTERLNGNATGHDYHVEHMNLTPAGVANGKWTIDSTTVDAVVIVGVFKEPSAATGKPGLILGVGVRQ